MNKALTRLQRVLDLEASQGYKNKAVVGGIRQFATFWVGQAREAAVSERDQVLVEQVAEVLADYGRLPRTEARAKVIEQLQAKLQQRQAQEEARVQARRELLRRRFSGACETPKEFLTKVNHALHGTIDNRWFVTMTCVQIIDEERTLRIARAGHCPTLVVQQGQAQFTRSPGIGLGIAKPALFQRVLQEEVVKFERRGLRHILQRRASRSQKPWGRGARVRTIADDCGASRRPALQPRNVMQSSRESISLPTAKAL